jgi:hypothetical protein
MFDIPSVLFVAACSKEQLFQLIDASSHARRVGIGSETPASGLGHRASKHISRPARLSCAVDTLMGGMHALPDWCGPISPDDGLSLLLQPMDSTGACD